MWALGILIGSIIFLIPFQAYAQSLSELERQLDEQNLERAKEITSGQSEQQTFQKIDCLPGQIEKAVSGGGIICVQDPQAVFSADDNAGLIAIGVIVAIIIIGGITVAARKKSEPEKLERFGWTEIEKEQVRIRQNGLCNKCKKPPPRWEYDHIDGNRSNNDLSNCQGLCPNCHSIKTHEESN